MSWRLFHALLLVSLLCGFASPPAGRSIPWQGVVGIPGGIPNRTTICTTITAATYGNGVSDATSGIQTALNSCAANGVVLLSAGTFRIATTLSIPSQVSLRGAGPDQTILNALGSSSAIISFGAGAEPNISNSTGITAGLTQGSTSLTVTSATGISVGTYLFVHQLNDTAVTIAGGGGSCTWCDGGIGWNGTRVQGQMVEVTSVSGTTIGIQPGLYITYQSSLTPQATFLTVGGHHGGLESLQLYANNSGYTTNILMNGTAYCWVKNVESNFADGDHFQAHWSYRGEVRDSYFHDGFKHGPGSTDTTVLLSDKSSAFLVENNIFWRQHVSVMVQWGAAGNVIGYNYSHGSYDESTLNFMIPDLSDDHGAHPMMSLWEGNHGTTFNADSIWGSSSLGTLYRNWFHGATQACNPQNARGALTGCQWEVQAVRASALDAMQRSYNLLGNVLASADMLALTAYNSGGSPMAATANLVWPSTRSYDAATYGLTWGYDGAGASDDGSNANDNAFPYSTAFLHGNYNHVDGSILWDSGTADHTLAPSLYLTAKPAWFGTVPWPPIGPDVTGGDVTGQVAGHVNRIPAQRCFESMTMGGSFPTGQFNATTCYATASAPAPVVLRLIK